MAEQVPTTAETMVGLIEAAMAANPLVATVTVDGQTVSYNRQQAMAELLYWRKRVAKEAGKSPFRGINMGGSF